MVRATVLILALVVAASSPAQAQRQVPHVPAGVYSGLYTCTGGRATPIDIYVPGDTITMESQWGSDTRQRVRVTFGSTGIFAGQVLVNGTGHLRIYEEIREQAPAGGWDRNAVVIDFAGSVEQMSGDLSIGHLQCVLRPNPRGTPQPLALMSYPNRPEGAHVDHAAHRGTVPNGFVSYTPPSANSAAMSRAVTEAVTADADSWLVNRLARDSITDFHYFQSSQTADVYVWAAYTYVGYDGFDSDGWVAARFRNGGLDCIQYHDRDFCGRPRQSRQNQLATLGQGRPHLGPMSIRSDCFVEGTRTESRSREVVVDVDRRTGVQTRTEYYLVEVPEIRFRCPSQRFELECVAAGADRLSEWVVGTGTTRQHNLVLTNGRPTGLSAGIMATYNARIADGTCVRVQ
jgi:hypothetical protein